MDENELFYKNQFGFRKQHSTSHAIITLVEKVSMTEVSLCIIMIITQRKNR